MRFILEREGSFATKDSERGAKALFGQLVTYICTYICINCPRGAFAPSHCFAARAWGFMKRVWKVLRLEGFNLYYLLK